MISATGSYTSYGTAAAIIKRIGEGAKKGANEWAESTLTIAQALAPDRSGELRGSGHLDPQESSTAIDISVVFNAGHAGFVEFGTGVHGRGTYPFQLPDEGIPITGAWEYDYRNIDWPGMEARPYLRPAYEETKDNAVPMMDAAVKEAI